jgi:hypothetical protein
MAFSVSPQPISLTAVPGQNSTFTVAGSTSRAPLSSYGYTYQWFLSSGSSRTLIEGATSASYTIDPLISDNGKIFFARVNVLSGTSLPLSSTTVSLTSNNAFLTVIEDVPPFNVYDLGTETGRERHRRLYLLGYI